MCEVARTVSSSFAEISPCSDGQAQQVAEEDERDGGDTTLAGDGMGGTATDTVVGRGGAEDKADGPRSLT